LAFLDETVFLLQPTRRSTWAPAGHTPTQKVSERRDRLSAIGAILVSPCLRRLSFHYQLLRENVSTDPLVLYLTQMHRHVHRPIILVWDGVPVHRSVAKWFERNHPTWFSFERLPAYAPELNPVEECWNHTKYADLANFVANDLNDLREHAAASMSGQRDNQALLRSHFWYAGLSLD
jgi:transposase